MMKRYTVILLVLITSEILPSALFKRYETLEPQVAHVSLGDLPTPVSHCAQLSQSLNCELSVKRDDLAGRLQSDGTRLFGGNKLRKLEFLLPDAQRKGYTTVLTRGCAGSNHALATAVYAQQLDLKAICLLADQPNSWVVQRNLLLQVIYGAELHHYTTTKERNASIPEHVQRCEAETGSAPYLIPPGGSIPVGVVGFINAIFELEDQIKEGKTVLPDYIYVATGSLGTTVGLLIGLQLISAPTIVVGVAVEPDDDYLKDARKLFEDTKSYLCGLDPSFSSLTWKDKQFILREQYYGEGYGYPTAAASKAEQLFTSEGIILEDTYTAKAAAALMQDAADGFLSGKKVLFWSTFYSEPCTEMLKKASYHQLPVEFQKKYFEKH
jgi:1-aminocyclopropane-1-carboxylate deaminase/D-cysteine desulfhydrase-like pyridoxal-dependent ACC family enzyme